MNLERFTKLLLENFGRKLGPEGIAVYSEILLHLSESQLDEAFRWAISTQQFMPTPLQIMEVFSPNDEQMFDELMQISIKLNACRYDSDFYQIKQAALSHANWMVSAYIAQTNNSILDLANQNEYEVSLERNKFRKYCNSKIPIVERGKMIGSSSM